MQSPKNSGFKVHGLEVGIDSPPVVVAEIGINHGGNLQEAIKLVDAAVDSGAMLIKHQTHIPDAEMSIEARSVIPGNASKSIYEVISENSLTESEEYALKNYVEEKGAFFFSTPFSIEAAHRLNSWGLNLFKIGSGECGHFPLVETVASFGKPVILSTGMHSVETIQTSVQILRNAQVPFVLMQATNLYPTPSELIKLGAITHLGQLFPDAILGLSDHSTTIGPALASIALGARVIEKHFTDSRHRVGPDIACSMDGSELTRLLRESKEIFLALGGKKEVQSEEQVTRNFAFPSVVARADIQAGQVITSRDLVLKRPAGGEYGPMDLASLIGKTASSFIRANTQLKSTDLQGKDD